MLMMLVVHVLGGGLAILAGYVALFSAKGARMHRGSGRLFVGSMVAMGLGGTGLAAVTGVPASVLGGLLVIYLVVTALRTVRPPAVGSRRLDAGLMLLAFALGLAFMAVGFRTLASPGGTMDGIPAAPSFMNGLVALLGGVSDLRVIRSGPPHGAARLARHLWRMCFALFVAAASFFLGQANTIPETLRIPPLLGLASLTPLAAMAYWLWRVRRPVDRGRADRLGDGRLRHSAAGFSVAPRPAHLDAVATQPHGGARSGRTPPASAMPL